MGTSDPTRRVAVFIDWQNAYRSARRAFLLDTMPNEHGNFSPLALGRLLAYGNGRGLAGELCKVEIHRGLPDSSKDPVGHGACRRQATAWRRESGLVHVNFRPLRYPRDGGPPGEKGIDVQLAVGIVECVMAGGCDVAVLISNDTDLLPALETAARLKGPASVETAAWRSETTSQRLRSKLDLYHHDISEAVFSRVERRVNYAYHEDATGG